MKRVFVLGILLGYVAFASAATTGETFTTDAPIHEPLAYTDDPSKPTAQIQLPVVDTSSLARTPVSATSKTEWQQYDSPIRQCIKGNIIIPSSGMDVFGFLFSNDAQTDINMAIQGFKQGKCAINLTEGVNTLYCHFNRTELQGLMNSILQENTFDRAGKLAEALSAACEATDSNALTFSH